MTHNADATAFHDVLEQLSVPRQQVVYVQSSVDWLQRAGFEAAAVIAALTDWVGHQGTLVMPAYPFVVSHHEYLENHPVYDMQRSPALVGLLPEIFRRSAGVVRSCDPDFCVAALGGEARHIVGEAPAAADPFGEDSSYQRMLDRTATLVGLGVSLNTTSFIHVIDSRVGSGYPSAVYDDRLFPVTVVDSSGQVHPVLRKALRPEFQLLTTPATIVDEMKPAADIFSTFEINGARFFRWKLDGWASWCLTHARQQAGIGNWPCWLRALDGRGKPAHNG